MAHVLPNMVRQTSTSGGLATLTLNGAAQKPYRAFSSAMSNGDTTDVMVVDRSTGAWQSAEYAYASGALTFVEFDDSSTGAQVDFPTGLKDVYVAPTAKRWQAMLDRLALLEPAVQGKTNLWQFSNDLSTPAAFAAAINAAVASLSLMVLAVPGGVIDIPPGDFTMGVPTANLVGVNEGAAVKLLAGANGITFRGAGIGATTIRPISNKVEMFSIQGATDISFEGIRFDNSDNGALQNQPKASTMVAGGGVAGLGNAANSAIRQYTGANLTVRFCEFIEMQGAVFYFGYQPDISVRTGTIDVQFNRFDGCAMGLLTQQPEHVVCSSNKFINGVDSVNSDSSRDPGHLLYISNRPGAAPYTVQANNNYWRNNSSSGLKMRKGFSQVATGNACDHAHRGIESHNATTVTITGNTLRIYNVTPGLDANQSCIEVSGCIGGGEVSNNTLDRSGSGGWHIRIRIADVDPDAEDAAGELPRNLHVHHNTMIDDGSGGVSKPFILLRGGTDIDVENNIARQTGTFSINDYLVDANDTTRLRVFDNARRTAAGSNPTGSQKLVWLGSGCMGSYVGWKRRDLDVAPQFGLGPTISDAGTNTTILRTDGDITGSWTPVPTFATPGNFVPANVTAVGDWHRVGPKVLATCYLVFDTNAYTTASGSFTITGLPFTAKTGTSRVWSAAVGRCQKVTIGSTTGISVAIANAASVLTLRANQTATTGVALSTSNLPASTTGIVFAFQISFEIDEP